MIGFGENLGSGFPKILDAWKEAKWNAPTLEDRLTTEEVRLTLPIPFAEFTAETEDTTINAEDTTINAEDTTINAEDTTINADDTTINTDDTTINTATKTMDIILSLIKQNPKITTKELAVLCGMTKDGVYYHIKKLKGKGCIVRDEGKRHGGQWIVIDGHSDTKKIGGS